MIPPLRRGWSVKPPLGSTPIRSHALCPDAAYLLNEAGGAVRQLVPGGGNTVVDTVSRLNAGYISSNSDTGDHRWVAGSLAGTAGPVVEWTSKATNTSIVVPPAVIETTQAVSIVVGYERTPGAYTATTMFGPNTSTPSDRATVSLPYSDGNIYWDFGGFTAGTSRLTLSAAGVTFGPDIWIFTAGARGMEIWQNGLRLAAQAATPTRTLSGYSNFLVGACLSGLTNDLAKVHFFSIYKRQISEADCRDISRAPYQWVAFPVLRTALLAPGLAGSALLEVTATATLKPLATPLIGTAMLVLTATATLTGGAAALAGSGTVAITATATLSGGGTTVPLAGSAALTLTATAMLGAITPALAGSALVTVTATAAGLVGTTARFEGRAHLVLTASAALTTGRSAATTALRLQRIQRPFGRVERV